MRDIATTTKQGTGSRLGHKAKIARLNGHPVYRWRVSFIDGGAHRRKGFKTKGDALAWAESREQEAAEHGTGFSLTASERQSVIEARESLAALGVNLREVIAKGLEYFTAAAKSCTVSELAAKVIADRESAGQSDRYLGDLRSRLARFVKSFGERPVATVTRDEIAEWLKSLKLSPASRNNFQRVLRVLFSEAVAGGYMADNPAAKVKAAKVIETEVGILTPAQTADLLATADVRIMPAIAIGAFAGLRDSEIHALDWAEVDLIGGHIRVRARNAKSSRNRLVAISENLRAWLKPIANESGPIWPRNGRKLMEAARSAAGISNWPSNALRHSFGSYALAFRRDAAAVALEMGHESTRIIFRHYRELVSPEIAAKYWEIHPDH